MRKTICALLAGLLLFPAAVSASPWDLASLSDRQLADLARAVAAERQERFKRGGYLAFGEVCGIFLGLKHMEIQRRNGRDLLVLVMDFSHSREDTQSYLWAADTKVLQDGEECRASFDFLHCSQDNRLLDIGKGETIEVAEAFELLSASPVEIRMDAAWNWGEAEPVWVTLDLPG
ncbi:MAG TPA: DUF5067 domain-containing protein [Candidatus Limnocylindria bacterium]|nr:DUF5067 domain-containing protein [Candidatus Limnocylindria bacterium]